MRIGRNPEKDKKDENKQYFHRIIIPVFIPNTSDKYFEDAIDVFELGLNSLIETINLETTVITVINNNSCEAVDDLCKVYKKYIDKYIHHNDNRGKVYAVLQEVYGSYEPFLTISDADVLFLKGWENEVFKIFKTFPKAGTVAPLPCPNLSTNRNSSVFTDLFWLGKIKYKKVVEDSTCQYLIDGINNDAMFDRYNRKFDWKQKQYVIESKSIKAIIGCGHFVATYKRSIFNEKQQFPKLKFLPGYEDKFIDSKADKKGGYRLSTSNLYAYHIGNKIDDNVLKLQQKDGLLFELDNFNGVNYHIPKSVLPYKLKKMIFRVIYKFFKL